MMDRKKCVTRVWLIFPFDPMPASLFLTLCIATLPMLMAIFF